ncbi:hypothetical protein LIER_36001 [Lithospermum erythrorhizon]|uniref:DUF4283 domain-containing protein n=1 Tax=Lithospermum erythrorhizon TaxID=34254 RepID=A0AAV3NZA7_LITER
MVPVGGLKPPDANKSGVEQGEKEKERQDVMGNLWWEAVIMVGEERWRNTVIGYVLGQNPNFREMEGFVRARWADFGEVKVHNMGKGVYVFQMESELAKMEVHGAFQGDR